MLDDPRYPIGRFQAPPSVSAEDRRAWIDQIDELPKMLHRAVEGLVDEQLDTRYREDGWTIRQVVHHVADSHLNAYARFRLSLTEDTPRIKPYLEARWAELADARLGPVDLSLELTAALHERWVYLLRAMSDEDWKRGYDHPQDGHVPLSRALGIYAWHGRHHLAHISSVRERQGW